MALQVSSLELSATLADAVALLESSPASSANNLETVLRNRLLVYYTRSNARESLELLGSIHTREDLELLTAREAISLLRRVQTILDVESDSSEEEPPPIGTRDLAKLQTLLSLVFKWGVSPLYARVARIWPESIAEGPKIIDLASDSDDYRILSELTTSLLALVFPQGTQGRISQTLITTSILVKHLTDLLLPSIALGWLPESLSSSAMPVIHDLRPLVMRLMRLLPPAQTISALGGIVSSTSPSPPLHVRRACTSLLTKQLLRPDGVQGLYAAVFSDDDSNGDEANLEKLEQVARTLNSVPSNMKPQEYFQTIIPRVLQIFAKNAPTSHKRAAAFTIYRSFVPETPTRHSSEASTAVISIIHYPFLEDSTKLDPNRPSPRDTLTSLIALIANTEPSSIFISKMLSPLIPTLYSLAYNIDKYKAADPQLKESILGLLCSWGKIIDQPEGTSSLWSIIESGKDWDWKFDLEGNFWKLPKNRGGPAPALLMPQANTPPSNEEESDIDQNLFNLYPDPVHLVEILKMFDRGDISSSIFVNLLENYRDIKSHSEEESLRILHKLQIIMQMQQRLSEGTASNILRKPDKLLSFIYHVLVSSNTAMGGNDLPSPEDLEEGDSDDEAEDSGVIGPDDELVETTLTLLLSVLEADGSLSARTYPILNDIFSLLEPLSLKANNSALQPLSREARLVMTARLAELSGLQKPGNKAEDDAQEIYQRALKLLQDPILPVRAHGLILLRQLLGASYTKDQVSRALIPSILSILLQSVQDEDSYIFLNAVQGLALLADRFGKEIIQGLVRDYTAKLEGLGAGNLAQIDIDTRTRIGEALSLVIKRCGSALGAYVDQLVPPIYSVVRNTNIPIALRTSSISLLASCVDTYSLAVIPYIEDLCSGFIDLLQVETISLNNSIQPENDAKNSEESDPTSKQPPLRRAALHFISLLIRALTKLVYDEEGVNVTTILSKRAMERANITLGYLFSTDGDGLVRVMAREAKEGLEQLQRAMLGL